MQISQGYLKIRKNEADPKINKTTLCYKTFEIEKKNQTLNIGEFFTSK